MDEIIRSEYVAIEVPLKTLEFVIHFTLFARIRVMVLNGESHDSVV